ncbi:hypothetical protein BDQ12DRAFT_224622 [Crucibulum laeve]|uniref:Uncharacterized protein n=1 Tax=Crucibulum laeve TaxID=68775 RepID=A0A5C3LWN4_9AGAR|nr:hypothetical protein BDQ12DRAFT_224622 [Crucibulum laeve]
MLNSMRFGNLEQATIDAFKALSREIVYTDGIQPTELFPTRAEVENSNQSRLRQLPGLVYTYNANDHGGIDSRGQRISPQQTERLLERLIAPKAIHLKVGAQVMLIKVTIKRHIRTARLTTLCHGRI